VRGDCCEKLLLAGQRWSSGSSPWKWCRNPSLRGRNPARPRETRSAKNLFCAASAETNVNGSGHVWGPVAELFHMLVELGCLPADLGLRDAVDAEGLRQLVHAAGGDAGEVAVGGDRDQRGFGAFAALEEPIGELRAGRTRLRQRPSAKSRAWFNV